MADIDILYEVEVVEFADALLAGGLVDVEGEHGAVFFAYAAYAHGANIDIVFAADHAHAADDAGAVVVKDDNQCAGRLHFEVEIVDFDDFSLLKAKIPQTE